MPTFASWFARKMVPRLVLLLLTSLLFNIVSAQTSSVDPEGSLRGKPLFLRGMWAEDNLDFDANGNAKADYRVATFTVSGIDIRSVSRKSDRLEIEGQRVGLAFAPNGSTKRIKIKGKDYDGHVRIEIDGPAGTDFSKALASIFADDLASLVPQLPDYWLSYAKGHFGTPPTPTAILPTASAITPSANGTSSSSIPAASAPSATRPPSASLANPSGTNHVGGSVKPPKLLHQVDPDFSQAARLTKYSGNVEVYLWVGEDGVPYHLRVAKPAGMGLDEQALKAVAAYRFAPATRDGQPVKVELYIDVNFQIF